MLGCFSKGAYVDEVVVEHARHASDGALDDDVAVEQLGAIGAVFEQTVEFVDVLHGDFEALVAEEHVFQTALEILVGALQEAVELVDVLEQDVGHVGDGLFEQLVQQMDAEDDLGDGLDQGVELALWVVPPVAVVCEVVRQLGGALFAAQGLLAALDALFGAGEGHMARLARGIEHRLLEGRLHGGQRVDGERGRHDGLVAPVVPFEGVAAEGVGAVAALRGPSKGDHGDAAPTPERSLFSSVYRTVYRRRRAVDGAPCYSPLRRALQTGGLCISTRDAQLAAGLVRAEFSRAARGSACRREGGGWAGRWSSTTRAAVGGSRRGMATVQRSQAAGRHWHRSQLTGHRPLIRLPPRRGFCPPGALQPCRRPGCIGPGAAAQPL